MIKSNWIKRGAAAVVMAGLLGTAVPSVVLAVETPAPQGNELAEGLDTQEIIKKSYSGKVPTSETFKFEITYKSGLNVSQGSNVPEYDGTYKDGKAHELTFLPTDNSWANGDSVVKKFNDLFSAEDFNTPGQYVFEVHENAPTGGLAKGDAHHWLIVVNVSWDDDYPTAKNTVVRDVKAYDAGTSEPAGTKLADIVKDSSKKKETATFTNTNADDLGSLVVKKQVSGTAANTEKDSFEFKVVLEGNLSAGTYTGTITDAPDGQNGSVAFTKKSEGKYEATVRLKHDSVLTVPNLPNNTKWTVTETGKGTYEDTVVSGLDSSLEDGDVPTSTKPKDDKDDAVEQGSATGFLKATDKINNDEDKVLFTNTKGFIPNTGITMNTLPFVAVGAVAAAGAVTLVVSRVRRAHEDF